MADRRIYKVIFYSQGKIYEVFAKVVAQGGLAGFIEVEQLLFGQRSEVVVDPSEDQLKAEFKDVKRIYLPLHSVLRIDQVEKQGISRITAAPKGEGTLSPFPAPVYGNPERGPGKK